MKEIHYCPICDIDCFYCADLNYECLINDPMNECDDYAFYNSEGEDEE